MRKIRFKPLAALAAVLVPLMAAAGVITHTATYDYSNLTLGTDTLGGVTYTTVHYDGLYNGGDPGMPSLPIDYLRFSVPYNATNFSVTASIGATVITSINHLVYPCQAPRMMNDTTPVTITLPDTSAYYTNTLYPSQRAWVVDEGFLAGENHIVTVAVMPIAYKHASSGMMRNSIRKSSSINLTLSYELSEYTSLRPIVREDTALRNEGYQLTQSIVINPSQVKPNSPSVFIPIDTLPNQSRGGGLDPFFPPHDSLVVDTTGIGTGVLYLTDAKYLIVTTRELYHSMRRLAALKRQKGYSVEIVTIEDIRRDPRANQGDIIKKSDGSIYVSYGDDAGKLRQFLKYADKYMGTKYVLLGGTDIPYREHDIYPGASDMYYCDLNSDWNTNNDNWYLNFDPQPDIYVGRLLGKVSSQFENYTDKLYPGNGDYSYLNKALFTEGKGLQTLFFGKMGEHMTSVCSEQRLIEENTSEIYPKGCDVIDSINTFKPGFMASFNHGDPISITTYWQNNHVYRIWAIDTLKYSSDHETYNGLNFINNINHPFIYYSLSCKTIPYSIDGFYDVGVNFGESFTMGKDYGGPIYLGNTETVSYNSMELLSLKFADILSSGYYKVGEAEALSRAFSINNGRRDEGLAHNLLGDPSLEMWSDTPQEYTGITISRTDNSITVSGIDTPSTIVAYTDITGKVTQKNVSSSATLNGVSPNGSIMVYKHNYIPYIAPLLLQNYNINKSQYVIASDVMAGRSIDSNRSNGEVIVKSGVEYEIEASGTVTLDRGFEVEKGAIFAVYPSCF